MLCYLDLALFNLLFHLCTLTSMFFHRLNGRALLIPVLLCLLIAELGTNKLSTLHIAAFSVESAFNIYGNQATVLEVNPSPL